MAATETTEAIVNRHLDELAPYLKGLLQDAPAFGSIAIEAFLSDSKIYRIETRASISRLIPPRSESTNREGK